MTKNLKRVHLLIKGRVQMVGFRYFTSRKAKELNLNGWVKNLPTGEVEAIIEGKDSAISQLLDYCKRGPLFAHVTTLEVKEELYQGEFHDFTIRYV